MLTKDLLRFRCENGVIKPQFLSPRGRVGEWTGEMLALWRSLIGRSREEVDEIVLRHCHQLRSLQVAKGLNKLIADGAVFDEPEHLAKQRWQALLASATALTEQRGDGSLADHQRQVAAQLQREGGDAAEDLYGDLPGAATLTSVPEWSPQVLIERYNLAQAQGLLLYADAVEVFLPDADTGRRRALLKNLRWQRLLADVRHDHDGGLHVIVSGPGSVVDQRQRYGLQLALFLPAVVAQVSWSLEAQVRAPDAPRGRLMKLQLDERCGLRGHDRFLGYVPEELSSLVEQVRGKRPAWLVDPEPPLHIAAGGNVLVPDVACTIDGTQVCCEWFHRWHHRELRQRLNDLQAGLQVPWVIGVDRAIIKKKDYRDLEQHPAFDHHAFCFSGYPAMTTLIKAVERQVE